LVDQWFYRTLRRGLAIVAVAIGIQVCTPADFAWALGQADTDLQCLALTIYHESRGEPELGQAAVAHVVANRAKDRRFPPSICEVVYQHAGKSALGCEFTWTCDAVPDRPEDLIAWRKSVGIARRVYWGYAPDPTNGALWYHADHVEPSWAAALYPPQQLGEHLFYRDIGASSIARTEPPDVRAPRARKPLAVSATADVSRPRLSDAAKSVLQQLQVTMMVYAEDPRKRAVRINNAMYHQGDELAPGLTIATITSAAVVIKYENLQFWFTL
jgi:N-acetylmuramoyl-L-alanine amidase